MARSKPVGIAGALVFALVMGSSSAGAVIEGTGADLPGLPGPGIPPVGPEPAPDPAIPADAELVDGGPSFRAFRLRDGRHVAEFFPGPVFFQDKPGAWVAIDPTLEEDDRGGELRMRRGPKEGVRFAAAQRGQGTVVRIGSPADEVRVRYPDSPGATVAQARGPEARYANGLDKGRDLVLTATVNGWKESVSVPSVAGGHSYRSVFSVPPGVRAQEVPGGVEFVDGGRVVGRFGGGLAWDSATSPSEVPVRVALLHQRGLDVTVEVSADSEWFNSAERVFPIMIDPVYERILGADSCPTSPSPYQACDTYVNSDNKDGNSGVGYWQNPELRMGSSGAYEEGAAPKLSDTRTFVKWETDNFGVAPYRYPVTYASARLYVYDARGNTSPRSFYAYATTSSPTSNTVWNNMPAASGTALTASSSGVGYITWTVTGIVNNWFNGSTNHGIRFQAAAAGDTTSFRAMRPAGSGSSVAPRLYVEYSTLPPSEPRNVSATGASGSATVRWDEPLTDNGDPITSYQVRVRRASDGATLQSTSVGWSARQYTFSGLTDGVPVYMQVAATNSGGTSAYVTSNTVTPNSPPPPPHGVETYGDRGPTAAFVTWRHAAGVDPSTFVNYVVETRRTSDGSLVKSEVLENWDTTYDAEGLTPGTSYYFSIRSRNANGDSSAVVGAPVTPGVWTASAPPGPNEYVFLGGLPPEGSTLDPQMLGALAATHAEAKVTVTTNPPPPNLDVVVNTASGNDSYGHIVDHWYDRDDWLVILRSKRRDKVLAHGVDVHTVKAVTQLKSGTKERVHERSNRWEYRGWALWVTCPPGGPWWRCQIRDKREVLVVVSRGSHPRDGFINGVVTAHCKNPDGAYRCPDWVNAYFATF